MTPNSLPAPRSSLLVAGLAVIGLSISACSSGDNDASAAASDTTASTAVDAGDAATDAQANAGQAGQPGGGPAFGRGAVGEVNDVDGSTITVEQVAQDGTISETTVTTSDDTTVTETVTGSLDDLAVGDDVVVAGGTDGDVATSIAQGGGAIFAGRGPGGQPPSGDFQPPAGGFPDDFTPPDGSQPDDFTPPGGSFPDDFTPPDGSLPEGGFPGGQGGGFPGGPGGATFGTITEIGDGTITLETADGESVVVTVDDTTEVTVAAERSVSDIAVGDTIRVQSAATDDAADSGDPVTAETIVIQPAD